MKYYGYRIFGLDVSSEYELFIEKIEVNKPDLKIYKKKLDDINELNRENSIELSVYHNSAILYFYDKLRIKIDSGNCIVVECREEIDDRIVAQLLLGMVFGIVLHQRGEVPIHGSVIEVNKDYAIVIMGDSGAGKSSLCSEFIRCGSRFLSDDVARIIIEEEGIFVCPSYPIRRLKKDLLEKLNIIYSEENLVFGHDDKYYVMDKEHFCESKRHLKALINIIPSDVEQVIAKEVKGSAGINILTTNVYKPNMISSKEQEASVFKLIGNVIGKIPVINVYRPVNEISVQEQMRNIKGIIELE